MFNAPPTTGVINLNSHNTSKDQKPALSINTSEFDSSDSDI